MVIDTYMRFFYVYAENCLDKTIQFYLFHQNDDPILSRTFYLGKSFVLFRFGRFPLLFW